MGRDGVTRAATLGMLVATSITMAACSGGSGPDDRSRAADPGTAARGGDPQRYDDADFYAVPSPLPEGEPGDLLRYQPVDPPPAPVGSWWRVMYRSESVQGEPIAVTGLVAVPDAAAPPDGRAVVSVGHGTTGIADTCAPSRFTPQLAALDRRIGSPELGDLLGGFVEAGHVVAMTDYEGLGTPGVHPYLVGPSEGRSVLDAAKAAGQLPDAQTGTRLALWGYSQGGHAVLWATQLAEDWAPDLDLIGTVAGAPGSEMPATFAATGAVGSLNNRFVLIVAGFAAAYPEADPSLVLTDAGMAVLERARASDTCGAVGVDMSPAGGRPVVRDGFAARQPWTSLMTDNDPGHVATDDPVLVVHSAADETVPVAFSQTLVDRLCRLGQPTELRLYDPGEGHVAAMDDAAVDGLAWIDARLAGEPSAPTCDPRPARRVSS